MDNNFQKTITDRHASLKVDIIEACESFNHCSPNTAQLAG
jgi:hypothetical protein